MKEKTKKQQASREAKEEKRKHEMAMLGLNVDEGTMTCQKLYSLVTDEWSSFLVLDIRPSVHFNKTRMKIDNVINIPEELLKPGQTAEHIGIELSQQPRRQWKSLRHKVDFLIICDLETEGPPLTQPIKILIDAILRWDLGKQYESRVWILKGGFDIWRRMYPLHTTNKIADEDTTEGGVVSLGSKSPSSARKCKADEKKMKRKRSEIAGPQKIKEKVKNYRSKDISRKTQVWVDCSICYRKYNEDSQKLSSLTCGHIYCESCFVASIQNTTVTCSQCVYYYFFTNKINLRCDNPVNFDLEGVLNSLNHCSEDYNEGEILRPVAGEADSGAICNIKRSLGCLGDTQKELLNSSAGVCNEHPGNNSNFRCSCHKCWVCEQCIQDLGDHPKNKCKIISFKEEIEVRKQEHKRSLDIEGKICDASLSTIETHMSYLKDEIENHIGSIIQLQNLLNMHKKTEETLLKEMKSFKKMFGVGKSIKEELIAIESIALNVSTLDESNTALDKVKNKTEEISNWGKLSHTRVESSKVLIETLPHYKDYATPETRDTKPMVSSVNNGTKPLPNFSSIVFKEPITTAATQTSNASLTIAAHPAAETQRSRFSFELGESTNNKIKAEGTSTNISTDSLITTPTSSWGIFDSLGASMTGSSSSTNSDRTTSPGGLFGSFPHTGFIKTESNELISNATATPFSASKLSSISSCFNTTTTAITFAGCSATTAVTSTNSTSGIPLISGSTSSNIFSMGSKSSFRTTSTGRGMFESPNSIFREPVSSSSFGSLCGQISYNTATTTGSTYGQNSNTEDSSIFSNSSSALIFGGNSSGFGSGSGRVFLKCQKSKPAEFSNTTTILSSPSSGSVFGGGPNFGEALSFRTNSPRKFAEAKLGSGAAFESSSLGSFLGSLGSAAISSTSTKVLVSGGGAGNNGGLAFQ